jgi:hypothetical protein
MNFPLHRLSYILYHTYHKQHLVLPSSIILISPPLISFLPFSTPSLASPYILVSPNTMPPTASPTLITPSFFTANYVYPPFSLLPLLVASAVLILIPLVITSSTVSITPNLLSMTNLDSLSSCPPFLSHPHSQGFDGLGLFLVSIGLDLDYAHVELDFGETTKMVFDWDLHSFRGRWSYPSKQQAGSFESSSF